MPAVSAPSETTPFCCFSPCQRITERQGSSRFFCKSASLEYKIPGYVAPVPTFWRPRPLSYLPVFWNLKPPPPDLPFRTPKICTPLHPSHPIPGSVQLFSIFELFFFSRRLSNPVFNSLNSQFPSATFRLFPSATLIIHTLLPYSFLRISDLTSSIAGPRDSHLHYLPFPCLFPCL